jgi:hypothetical protein
MDNGRIISWDVVETGDWGKDNRVGRELAAATVARMRENDAPHELGHLMKSLIEKGRYGGVEVGFFLAIALLAMHH